MSLPVGDACFLNEIPCTGFHTGDLEGLEKELERASQFRHRIVFLESVNGMTGRMVNWTRLREVCKRHGASVVIDESFATGIYGIRGAGLSESMLLKTDVLAVLCDLNFGFGGVGSALVSSSMVRDLVVSRSNYFQTDGYPTAMAAALIANVDFIELQHAGRELLRNYREELTEGISNMNVEWFEAPDGAFCALEVDTFSKAKELSVELFRRGFLVDICASKRAHSERAIVRLVLNKGHSLEGIRLLLNAISEMKSHGDFYS